MEFEDSPVGQTPTSGPGEADIALTRCNNLQVPTAIRGVNAEATSCNVDTISEDDSDSGPEDEVTNHDMYDSGNDADVSVISDSESDSDIEICEVSEDSNSGIYNRSEDEADHAHTFLLNNLPKEDTFSGDISDSDLCEEPAEDPFCGFVDRSVVVEYICTVDFYETMASVSGNRRDIDVHPWSLEHHSTDRLSEESLMVV